jgi:hypothetical protein
LETREFPKKGKEYKSGITSSFSPLPRYAGERLFGASHAKQLDPRGIEHAGVVACFGLPEETDAVWIFGRLPGVCDGSSAHFECGQHITLQMICRHQHTGLAGQ